MTLNPPRGLVANMNRFHADRLTTTCFIHHVFVRVCAWLLAHKCSCPHLDLKSMSTILGFHHGSASCACLQNARSPYTLACVYRNLDSNLIFCIAMPDGGPRAAADMWQSSYAALPTLVLHFYVALLLGTRRFFRQAWEEHAKADKHNIRLLGVSFGAYVLKQ